MRQSGVMGRHSGDWFLEFTACESSVATVVYCVCDGIVIGTVGARRGSIFGGFGHRGGAR